MQGLNKIFLWGLLFLLFLWGGALAEEVCFPQEQALKIVVELEQKRIMEKEIAEYEELVKNLKKQNELLKEQVNLLKEQVELTKNQVQLYKVAYEEEKKKHGAGFFEKAKWFGMGIGLGVIFGIFGL